jgi:hypothetical protein
MPRVSFSLGDFCAVWLEKREGGYSLQRYEQLAVGAMLWVSGIFWP